MRKHTLYIRGLSVGVAICLALVTHTLPVPKAQAADFLSLPTAGREIFNDITAIRLPEEIGEIQEFYRGSMDKIVVLIQDAHSIPDAQNSIRALIKFFQQTYGFDLTLVEGAATGLDAQFFKSFPDKNILTRTFKEYMSRGELTGANAAAIFNPGNQIYHGIENWDLYEEEIAAFLDALKRENEILIDLDNYTRELDSLKRSFYSPQLLEIDQTISAFNDERINLAEYLKILTRFKSPERGSKLDAIVALTADQNQESIDIEVKHVAVKVKEHLQSNTASANAPDDMREFNRVRQEYQVSQATPEAFGLLLRKLISKYNMPIRVSKKFEQRVGKQKTMRDIKGTQLFKELKQFEADVKKGLITDERQYQLDSETQSLSLLRRFTKLELDQNDWQIIRQKADQLNEWMLSADGVLTQTRLEGLFKRLRPHFEFYRIARARDHVFLEESLDLMKHYQKSRALLVTGGFHTEGLTQNFKAKGISYLLVTPGIKSLPENIHYRDHMQGKVSWSHYFNVTDGKVSLYDAFMRGARDALLLQTNERRGVFLKKWRDQIIRDLADTGRIDAAHNYIRFIDELSGSEEDLTPLKNRWIAAVENFIEGMRGLDRQGMLNEQNIMGLMHPSSVATPGPLSAALASEASYGRIDLLPYAAARFEMRSQDGLDDDIEISLEHETEEIEDAEFWRRIEVRADQAAGGGYWDRALMLYKDLLAHFEQQSYAPASLARVNRKLDILKATLRKTHLENIHPTNDGTNAMDIPDIGLSPKDTFTLAELQNRLFDRLSQISDDIQADYERAFPELQRLIALEADHNKNEVDALLEELTNFYRHSSNFISAEMAVRALMELSEMFSAEQSASKNRRDINALLRRMIRRAQSAHQIDYNEQGYYSDGYVLEELPKVDDLRNLARLNIEFGLEVNKKGEWVVKVGNRSHAYGRSLHMHPMPGNPAPSLVDVELGASSFSQWGITYVENNRADMRLPKKLSEDSEGDAAATKELSKIIDRGFEAEGGRISAEQFKLLIGFPSRVAILAKAGIAVAHYPWEDIERLEFENDGTIMLTTKEGRTIEINDERAPAKPVENEKLSEEEADRSEFRTSDNALTRWRDLFLRVSKENKLNIGSLRELLLDAVQRQLPQFRGDLYVAGSGHYLADHLGVVDLEIVRDIDLVFTKGANEQIEPREFVGVIQSVFSDLNQELKLGWDVVAAGRAIDFGKLQLEVQDFVTSSELIDITFNNNLGPNIGDEREGKFAPLLRLLDYTKAIKKYLEAEMLITTQDGVFSDNFEHYSRAFLNASAAEITNLRTEIIAEGGPLDSLREIYLDLVVAESEVALEERLAANLGSGINPPIEYERHEQRTREIDFRTADVEIPDTPVRIIAYHGITSAREVARENAAPETLGVGRYFSTYDAAVDYALRRANMRGGEPVLETYLLNQLNLLALDQKNRLPIEIEKAWRTHLLRSIAVGAEGAEQRPWTYSAKVGEILNLPLGSHVTELQTGGLQGDFSQFLMKRGIDGLIAFEGGEGTMGTHKTIVVFDRAHPDMSLIESGTIREDLDQSVRNELRSTAEDDRRLSQRVSQFFLTHPSMTGFIVDQSNLAEEWDSFVGETPLFRPSAMVTSSSQRQLPIFVRVNVLENNEREILQIVVPASQEVVVRTFLQGQNLADTLQTKILTYEEFLETGGKLNPELTEASLPQLMPNFEADYSAEWNTLPAIYREVIEAQPHIRVLGYLGKGNVGKVFAAEVEIDGQKRIEAIKVPIAEGADLEETLLREVFVSKITKAGFGESNVPKVYGWLGEKTNNAEDNLLVGIQAYRMELKIGMNPKEAAKVKGVDAGQIVEQVRNMYQLMGFDVGDGKAENIIVPLSADSNLRVEDADYIDLDSIVPPADMVVEYFNNHPEEKNRLQSLRIGNVFIGSTAGSNEGLRSEFRSSEEKPEDRKTAFITARDRYWMMNQMLLQFLTEWFDMDAIRARGEFKYFDYGPGYPPVAFQSTAQMLSRHLQTNESVDVVAKGIDRKLVSRVVDDPFGETILLDDEDTIMAEQYGLSEKLPKTKEKLFGGPYGNTKPYAKFESENNPLITFEEANIFALDQLGDTPDLAVLNNVLIYYEKEQAQVLENFQFHLNERGILIVGDMSIGPLESASYVVFQKDGKSLKSNQVFVGFGRSGFSDLVAMESSQEIQSALRQLEAQFHQEFDGRFQVPVSPELAGLVETTLNQMGFNAEVIQFLNNGENVHVLRLRPVSEQKAINSLSHFLPQQRSEIRVEDFLNGLRAANPSGIETLSYDDFQGDIQDLTLKIFNAMQKQKTLVLDIESFKAGIGIEFNRDVANNDRLIDKMSMIGLRLQKAVALIEFTLSLGESGQLIDVTEADIPTDTYTSPGWIVKELVHNALNHGNKYNFELPVALNLSHDGEKFDVIEVLDFGTEIVTLPFHFYSSDNLGGRERFVSSVLKDSPWRFSQGNIIPKNFVNNLGVYREAASLAVRNADGNVYAHSVKVINRDLPESRVRVDKVAHNIGRRSYDEDRHIIASIDAQGIPGDLHARGQLLAVLDGHSGDVTAEYAAQTFDLYFTQALTEMGGNVVYALRSSIDKMANRLRHQISGATFTAVYLPEDEETAYIANMGDSAALLYKEETDAKGRRRASMLTQTTEHAAMDDAEKNVITQKIHADLMTGQPPYMSDELYQDIMFDEDGNLRDEIGRLTVIELSYFFVSENGYWYLNDPETDSGVQPTRGFGDFLFNNYRFNVPDIQAYDYSNDTGKLNVLLFTDGIQSDQKAPLNRRYRDVLNRTQVDLAPGVTVGDYLITTSTSSDNKTVLRAEINRIGESAPKSELRSEGSAQSFDAEGLLSLAKGNGYMGESLLTQFTGLIPNARKILQNPALNVFVENDEDMLEMLTGLRSVLDDLFNQSINGSQFERTFSDVLNGAVSPTVIFSALLQEDIYFNENGDKVNMINWLNGYYRSLGIEGFDMWVEEITPQEARSSPLYLKFAFDNESEESIRIKQVVDRMEEAGAKIPVLVMAYEGRYDWVPIIMNPLVEHDQEPGNIGVYSYTDSGASTYNNYISLRSFSYVKNLTKKSIPEIVSTLAHEIDHAVFQLLHESERKRESRLISRRGEERLALQAQLDEETDSQQRVQIEEKIEQLSKANRLAVDVLKLKAFKHRTGSALAKEGLARKLEDSFFRNQAEGLVEQSDFEFKADLKQALEIIGMSGNVQEDASMRMSLYSLGYGVISALSESVSGRDLYLTDELERVILDNPNLLKTFMSEKARSHAALIARYNEELGTGFQATPDEDLRRVLTDAFGVNIDDYLLDDFTRSTFLQTKLYVQGLSEEAVFAQLESFAARGSGRITRFFETALREQWTPARTLEAIIFFELKHEALEEIWSSILPLQKDRQMDGEQESAPRSEQRIDFAPALSSFESLSIAKQLIPDSLLSQILNQLGLPELKSLTAEQSAEKSLNFVNTAGFDAMKNSMIESIVLLFLQKSSGAAEFDWTSENMTVLRNEIQALIATLQDLKEQQHSLGLALPDDSDLVKDMPLLRQLLKLQRSSKSTVSEYLVNGQLDAATSGQLKENALLRSVNLKRRPTLLNDQPAVPLLVLVDMLTNVDRMFIPIKADLSEVEDPMMIDFAELLRTVAALHMADLLAQQPELAQNADLLQSALLARLQMFQGASEGILTHDGTGWIVQGTAAKLYLEMQIAEAAAKSA